MYNNYSRSENPNQTFSKNARLIKLLLGLLVLFSCGMTAQIEKYSFQVSSGTYTPITGGQILNVNDPTPDQISSDFPIFFGFFDYTTIRVADTGALYFAVGATVIDPDDEFGNAISNNLGLAAIAPFSCNTNGYVDREIRYQTLGTAPNRVLVIQWKGFLRQYAANPERFEYQCRIYETTNKIEFIYGNFTNPTNLQLSGQTGAEVGLRGGTYPYPSFKNLTLDASGSWASPTVGTGNSQARCHYNGDAPNTKPTSGLTYRFSPYDLSVSILPLPAGCAPGQMTVRITNTGAAAYDFVANPIGVTASVYPITQNFSSLINTGSLGAGGVRDVTFTAAFPVGIYYTLSAAISTPANDLNAANNTAASYPYVGVYAVPYNVATPFNAQLSDYIIDAISGNITPAVGPLGTNDEFRFTCKTTYDYYEQGSQTFDVLVSTNCGASYNTAYTDVPVGIGANEQSEKNIRLSLAAYAGQTVMLKFVPKVTTYPDQTFTFTNMRFDHAAPPCVTNMLPANGTTTTGTNVTVSWNASVGATSYDVYMGTAANALTLVYNTAQTSYTSNLVPLTQYFWRIIPKNAVAAGDDCTTTGTFTTSVAFTDLSVTGIVVPTDCPHTGNILVTVKNVGISSIDFAALNASVNLSKAGPSITENFVHYLTTGILAPNESRQISLTNANFNTPGTYPITATVWLASDAFADNNSMTFSKIIGAVQAVPYILPEEEIYAASSESPSYITPVTGVVGVGDHFAFDFRTKSTYGAEGISFTSTMRIEVSTGCNETYQLITEVPYVVTGSWQNYSDTVPVDIDLSPYAGQYVKLRMVVPSHYYSQILNNWPAAHLTNFSHIRFYKIPTCTTGTSPANGAQLLTDATPYQTTVLSWNPVPTATEYEVYFGTTPNPPYVGIVETPSYSPGLLSPGTQYYWKVLGRHVDAIASGCEVQTFTTGYCTPRTYLGTFGDRQITGVQLGTLNSQTGGAPSYPYHTFYSNATVPNIGQNQTITVTVTMGLSQNQYAAAWIDFNRNRIFEPSEGVASSAPTSFGGSTTLTFTVPENAVVGQTVMRVRNGITYAFALSMSCGEPYGLYGESEDYYVNITPSTVYAQCALTQSPANAATNVVLNDNSVTLSWAPVTIGLPVASYDVYAGTTAANMVLKGNTTSSSFILTNLFHASTYYWKVIPKTSTGVTSLDCNVFSFTTHNPFLPYCSNIQYQYFTEPITNVTFAGINNTSTNATVPAPNNYGIQDFISVTGNVTRGLTYPMTIKAAVSGYCYFQVYIDWNQNGNFNDAGESYYGGEMENSTGTDNFYTSLSIAVPADALRGTTRMRVQKSGNFSPNPCSAGNTVGQIEDYSIIVSARVTECVTIISPPNNSNIATATGNYLTFSWAPSPTGPPATSYTLYFGLTPNELPGNITVTGTSWTSMVAIGTTYYWKVVPHAELGDDPVNCPVYSFTGQSQVYPYCGPVTFTNGVYPITTVNFAGINNTSNSGVDGSTSHENFIPVTANVTRESTYPITLKGNTGSNNTFYFNIFIDWNHDNDFDDAGESINGGSVSNSTGIDSIQSLTNITVPANAALGTTRMRIRFQNQAGFSPCNNVNYGQAEDYSVNVTNCAQSTWYADADSDGFGNPDVTSLACSQPAGYVSNNTDCTDANPNIHQTFPFYTDTDGDTYGSGNPIQVCAVNGITPPAGFVVNHTDCDDADLLIYLNAPLYIDADNDGYTSGATQVICHGAIIPAGFVASLTVIDCNDTTAAIHPNATEIAYNVIDDDCDGLVDEGFVPISTVIQSAMCNTTLSAIDSQLTANVAAGAQGYRWRITTMNGPTTGQVQTLDTSLRVMKLTQLVNYAFNTQYKVEISVRYAGFWQPFTASGCTVTTPAANTTLAVCGQALSGMPNVIYANLVPYAAGYRFRITDPINALNTQTIERNVREFRMNLIANFTVQYGKSYNVDVSVKNTDGTWLPYGGICTVTTPAFPTSSLQDSQCNDYMVPNSNTPIYAIAYPGAIAYVFQLSGAGLPSPIEITKTTRTFTLNDFAGLLLPGATYNVKVRLVFNLNDLAGPFGKVCTITTPGLSRQIEVKAAGFNAVAYPNPFAESFNIDVSSASSETITIKIYDMIGRTLETRQLKPGSGSSEIGSHFPSGVYNLVVTQGDNAKTLRVVKR
jgi:hypothetical protein